MEAPSQAPTPAGFWRRFGAYLIDSTIGSLLGWIPILVLFPVLGAERLAEMATSAQGSVVGFLVGTLLPFVLGWVYVAGFESSRYGGTPGKIASGIRVTDASGERVSFLRASGRLFAKILSAIPLCLGFLMIGFTSEKRGLHDMIAGTRVVAYRRSRFWLIFVVSMLLSALIVGGGSAWFVKVQLPKLEEAMLGALGDLEGFEDLGYAGLGGDEPSATFEPMGEAEIDALLARSAPPSEARIHASAGPVLLEVDGAGAGTLSIGVRMPPLPNLGHDGAVRFLTDRVSSTEGTDLLDRAGESMSDGGTGMIQPTSYPEPAFMGGISVRIAEEATEEQVEEVHGRLLLSIPTQVETLDLDAVSQGVPVVATGGQSATLTIDGEGSATVSWSGSRGSLLSTRAFDLDGTEIPIYGNSSFATAAGVEMSLYLEGTPARIELVIASAFAERVFEVTLDAAGGSAEAVPDRNPRTPLPASERGAGAVLGEADYDRLLASHGVWVDGEPAANLGPVSVSLARIIDGGDGDALELAVEVLPIPALASDDFARLSLDAVVARDGSSWLDPERERYEDGDLSGFEDLSSDAVPSYRATRTVWLGADATEATLAGRFAASLVEEISGTVTLRLPLGIETLRLEVSEEGGRVASADGTLAATLTGFQESYVELDLARTDGATDPGEELLLEARLIAADGRVLPLLYSSQSGTARAFQAEEPPAAVELVVASGFAERAYPFAIRPGAEAPPPVAPAVDVEPEPLPTPEPADPEPEPEPEAAPEPEPEATPEPEPEATPAPEPEPEPVAAPAAPARPTTVKGWLARAEQQFARLALTSPAGDNAYESYREVLAREPSNVFARQGLARIQRRYLDWAEEAAARGDLARARAQLSRAASIEPGDPRVEAEIDALRARLGER